MSQFNVAKIAKSSSWLIAGFVLSKLSQLISQVYLARLLSPADFGIWGMVLIVTTLSALFKEQAISSVLIQRGLEDQTRVNTVYSLGINISVGMFILQTIFGYLLAQFFGIPILWPLTVCTGLVFVIGAGSGVRSAILNRQMKFREMAICEICMAIARLGGAVFCGLLGGGVWSFLVGELCMESAYALCTRWICRYKLTYHLKLNREAIEDVSHFITSSIGINLAVYMNTTCDNLIVGKLLGARPLGYYGVAYQLAMLPTFALSQINRISFAILSQCDSWEQQAYITKLIEIYAILYTPIYGLGFILSPWLIPALYGSEWQETVIILQIILIFAYTRGFMAILGTALNAMNRPGVNAVINWTLVPISLPAFYLGAKLGNTIGVAISATLVMGVGATVWFWIITCKVAYWPLGTLLKPIVLPTIMILIAIAIANQLHLSGLSQIILPPLLLVFIYAAGLSLFSRGRIPKLFISLTQKAFS